MLKTKTMVVILAALMLLCSSVAVFAVETKNGSCGENVVWRLDDAGLLTVSGSGEMENYEESPWEDAQIKAVVIEPGVTSIGNYAFAECAALTSVSLPDGLEKIRTHAFYGCESLADVRIPESLTWIGYHAFENCKALTSLTLPDHMSFIGAAAFHNCGNLSYIRMPLVLEHLGEGAFSGCTGLLKIALPTGVGAIEVGTFALCKNLRAVYAPEDVYVFRMDAFSGCEQLEKLIVCNPECVIYSDYPESAVVYGRPDSSLEKSVLAKGAAFAELGTDDAISGDLDNDHLLSASDARDALRTAVGLEPVGERGALADVDFDGAITAADARIILRGAVGLEVLF